MCHMTGLVFSDVLRDMAAILHVSFRRLIRLKMTKNKNTYRRLAYKLAIYVATACMHVQCIYT